MESAAMACSLPGPHCERPPLMQNRAACSAVLRTRVHARFLSSLALLLVHARLLSSLACLASSCSAALELQMQSFSLVLPISRRCETAKEFLTHTWYCILSSLKAKTFPTYRKCARKIGHSTTTTGHAYAGNRQLANVGLAQACPN